MCLTEPQCGTDLGLIRTKAEPTEKDGSLQDHRHQDLHLRRRARPDREHPPSRAGAHAGAPAGHPRHQPLPRAEVPGRRTTAASARATACAAARSSTRWGSRPRRPASSISTTPRARLVGEPHKGMRAMFTMMNAARLGVGAAGPGPGRDRLSERARQYAMDRLQGRALAGRQVSGQAGRSHHRPSRRPAHAAHHEGLYRRRPRARRLGVAGARHAPSAIPIPRRARRPRTSSA